MSDYGLKIADDTGEIELELSSLEPGNYVSKFGFSDLALIEKKNVNHDDSNSKQTNMITATM